MFTYLKDALAHFGPSAGPGAAHHAILPSSVFDKIIEWADGEVAVMFSQATATHTPHGVSVQLPAGGLHRLHELFAQEPAAPGDVTPLA